MARLDNQEAYAALFTRYTYAAHRLARHLGQRHDAEDVVSESFAQVLDLVRRGKGPDRAFRAYLFTTIRHESARRAKARRRVVPTDDERQIDSAVPFGDGELDEFERSAIRAAYESLPSRWRTVLWHLDVEGRKPHELGPLLGLSSNSVSALVYRARSGLREAYLQQHVNLDGQTDSHICREVRAKLPALVRQTLSVREQEKSHAHLQQCATCLGVYLDLKEVNRDVGEIFIAGAVSVSVGGVVAGGIGSAGGLAAFATHLTLVVKGVVLALAPPVAAAALTTATVVGVSTRGGAETPHYETNTETNMSRPVAEGPMVPPSADGSSDAAAVTTELAGPAPRSRIDLSAQADNEPSDEPGSRTPDDPAADDVTPRTDASVELPGDQVVPRMDSPVLHGGVARPVGGAGQGPQSEVPTPRTVPPTRPIAPAAPVVPTEPQADGAGADGLDAGSSPISADLQGSAPQQLSEL